MNNNKVPRVMAIFLCLACLVMGKTSAWARKPPDISVDLRLDKAFYLLGETISVILTSRNESGEVIVPVDAKIHDSQYYLQIIDPNGFTS